MAHSTGVYDALTLLPNRRLLIDRLGQMMADCQRSGQHGALLFLDLDNFKPLNDSYGHGVGDLLLVEVARPYHLTVLQDPGAATEVLHRCTSSNGIAMFHEQAASADEVLNRADMAMYRAKDSGRNAVRFHEPMLRQ